VKEPESGGFLMLAQELTRVIRTVENRPASGVLVGSLRIPMSEKRSKYLERN
jgi:hypothetical protein